MATADTIRLSEFLVTFFYGKNNNFDKNMLGYI
jgi:hypothetical protein